MTYSKSILNQILIFFYKRQRESKDNKQSLPGCCNTQYVTCITKTTFYTYVVHMCVHLHVHVVSVTYMPLRLLTRYSNKASSLTRLLCAFQLFFVYFQHPVPMLVYNTKQDAKMVTHLPLTIKCCWINDSILLENLEIKSIKQTSNFFSHRPNPSLKNAINSINWKQGKTVFQAPVANYQKKSLAQRTRSTGVVTKEVRYNTCTCCEYLNSIRSVCMMVQLIK